MPILTHGWRCLGAPMLAISFIATAAISATGPGEASFLAENQTAMDKMMAGMSVKPTGDVDRDFVAMMVPHHQGAVDMARAELRYGHNEKLLRVARQIIAEQPKEIIAMRQAIGLPPNETASPSPAKSGMVMPGMK